MDPEQTSSLSSGTLTAEIAVLASGEKILGSLYFVST